MWAVSLWLLACAPTAAGASAAKAPDEPDTVLCTRWTQDTSVCFGYYRPLEGASGAVIITGPLAAGLEARLLARRLAGRHLECVVGPLGEEVPPRSTPTEAWVSSAVGLLGPGVQRLGLVLMGGHLPSLDQRALRGLALAYAAWVEPSGSVPAEVLAERMTYFPADSLVVLVDWSDAASRDVAIALSGLLNRVRLYGYLSESIGPGIWAVDLVWGRLESGLSAAMGLEERPRDGQ